MKHLVNNRPIKNSQDLQELADDLFTADLAFNAVGKAFNSQHLISGIVNRLNRYHANRWRKHALDFKQNNTDYPDLNCFMKFIKSAAADANDPVY